MILEGIVTTLNSDGSANISPMGPLVDPEITRFTLRPFQTSTTYKNLLRTGEGVLHVTDDVELLARAAIGPLDPLPPLLPATSVQGVILADACRWFAFRVTSMDNSSQRTTIDCEVIDQGRIRDFFGFNRAKHAVIEAAILATRIAILPADQIRAEMLRLTVPVEKTAGEAEKRAFSLLQSFIEQALK